MFEVMYRCMQVQFHVTIFEELYSMGHIATDQFTATTQRSTCYQYYIIISKSNPIWRKTVWCKDWCGSTPSHIDFPDPTSIGCAIGSRHCGLPKANITLVQFRRQMESEHMQLESSQALSGSKMTFPFSIPPRVPNFSCYDDLWWRTLKE